MSSSFAKQDLMIGSDQPDVAGFADRSIAGGSSRRTRYQLTKGEVDRIFSRPIYKKVIASKAFQRLKSINFLGAIDYVFSPNPSRRHTRYQHSLGVALLALQFSRVRELTERQEIICVLSALLHDIGHAPLSHSLESVFIKEYGVGHHIVAERILRGEVPLGRSLLSALIEFSINPFEIMEVINGTGPEPYNEIFNFAINIDTIEGILRSTTYQHKKPKFLPPHEILNALNNRNAEATLVLDGFWRLKGEMYRELINSRQGVLADYICQEYMRKNKPSFLEDYYYATEGVLESNYPDLFSNLRKLAYVPASQLLPHTEKISFTRREFHVNTEVPLDSIWAINNRYTQTKSEAILQL